MDQPFEQITGLTDVAEGTIVRVITRLDETCREVRDAARVIGDTDLFKKMEEAQTKIKRDSKSKGTFQSNITPNISGLSRVRSILVLLASTDWRSGQCYAYNGIFDIVMSVMSQSPAGRQSSMYSRKAFDSVLLCSNF